MRSPDEFRRIQESNRSTLGMAGAPRVIRAVPIGMSGLGDGVLGGVLGSMGPITVGSAFPPFSYSYDPSQPSVAPATTGSWFTQFLVNSVFRPYVDIGNGSFRYDPGVNSGAADYSQIAAVGAVVVGLGVLGTIAWILVRAFGGSRRSNPRSRTRTRVYVQRRAA